MITALAGGVGGAKLVYGFAQLLPPEDFAAIVNTGDDFEYYGLKISPDIDSVTYALAGISNQKFGFGLEGDTFQVLQGLESLDEKPWFRLGDKDLAINLYRTQLLNNGYSLSQATRAILEKLKVAASVYPMTDDPISTHIHAKDGRTYEFQEYFVRHKYEPEIASIEYSGIEKAKIGEDAASALASSEYVILCPSNPWLSIFPILELPGMRSLLTGKKVIAVSPIIGNTAVKGPAGKIFSEFGLTPSALAVASLYGSLLDWLFIDQQNIAEQKEIEKLGIKTHVTDIMMGDAASKVRMAREILDLIKSQGI
jgi:LPPG:FO 2-phospho-L-lactate transferase